jgi:MEDS: MEthanogen/methylotroph, DcmR Sensory domain
MSSCAELLDQLKPAQHVVQLYGDDDRLLISNVGRYLAEGLRRGDGLLVIATPAHRTSLAGHLRQEASYSKAVLEGRLVFLDARLTLNRFLVDGAPDPALFRSVVGESIRTVQARGVHTGVRAYGEMVGLLWQDGLLDDAAHVEELWNELLAQSEVSLFCAYPVDVLGPEFQPNTIDALLSSHTHLLPVDPALAGALERAMDEVLGQRVNSLRPLLQANHRPSWGEIPPAEALVLWLRNKLPGSADQILARTREHYQPAARGLA